MVRTATTQPRKRPVTKLTLAPETRALLAMLADREGLGARGKSRVVDRLVVDEAHRLGLDQQPPK